LKKNPSILEGFSFFREGGSCHPDFQQMRSPPAFGRNFRHFFLFRHPVGDRPGKQLRMNRLKKGIGYRLRLHLILPVLYFVVLLAALLIKYL
jgi:hypothetical protein